MSGSTLITSERARRWHRPVTAPQRSTLTYLASEAGIEMPVVHDGRKASRAITRLEKIVREPTLGPM